MKTCPVLTLALFALCSLRAAETSPAPSPPITFKEIRVGRAVISLPSHWTAFDAEVPIWLHLHGAPEVVERNFAAVGAPGVLVNVTLPGLSKIYTDYFAAPEAFAGLLRDTETALRQESTAKPWRIGKVTVSSFSAGFGGVRELLKQPEAFERIRTIVMADSIYAGYVGAPAEKRVDPAAMAGFLRFARLAADGKKRMLITHSSQVPEGYASTTETADYLIAQLGGARTFATEEWPGGLRLRSNWSKGGLEILGFEGEAADDHMRHLRNLGAFLPRVAPVGPVVGATSLEALRTQLAALLDARRFAAATWSVKVVSLETGRTLFEHHADRLMSPASNSKLYTAALALDRFGGDYRIVTPILATAKPDAAGEVKGDVIISGRGDPSWSSDPRLKNFADIFTPFADALQHAGVRAVTGDMVADATYFRMPPNGAGWTADDLNDYYGAEISAISLEDNYAELHAAPGAREGEPGALAFLLPQTGLMIDNRTTTVAKGGARRLEPLRLFGENVVHVFGQLPVGGTEENLDITVPRPATWFAAALKDALVRRGIRVEGSARSVRWPDAPVATAGAVKLGEISSPPLRELIARFLKPSQNLETDLIFAHVGEATRTPETPAWRTSEQLGVSALREFLRKNHLPADDVRFEEGSGLSRNNLTTANATVALLQFMAARADAADYVNALPIAGVDGTLRRRMKETPAENNLHGKTGSLRWANSLSGYLTSAAGERLVFSAMVNRAVYPPERNAREDLDAIAVMLARFAGRSADGRAQPDAASAASAAAPAR
jgi:serine-type D-Ala-D-Ala carboxypeptidase/endopeptidase (penicillin-binding protein 4)